MGISNYLHEKAKEAILRDSKKESVKKSIKVIKERIDKYFDDVEHFIFGSYLRNTILPKSIDERADIDYMVVFKDNDLTPQSYLNKLRTFVETYYSNSEIKQSYPTIQLELNHITFELVPALDKGWFGNNYQIPSRNNAVDEWISTDPNDFNEILTQANQDNKSLIKPLIRLMKYWNAKNDYVFASYFLEQDIVETDYFLFNNEKSLKDYFYKYIESMEIGYLTAQWKKDKINKLKERVVSAQEKQEQGEKQEAENIIRKIFKDDAIDFNEKAMALNYVEQPKWQMMNIYSVDIKALIDGHCFSSNDLLDKNCDLIFNAKTNVAKPFNVHWQIVNTGKEALKAGCLRGEILEAKSAGAGGLIRKEATSYTGVHWVECFVIKQEQCIARSGKFKVRIK